MAALGMTPVKARVKLMEQGPLTFTGNGRTITRGQEFFVTKPQDIVYYQRQSGFAVEVIEGSGAASARGTRRARSSSPDDEETVSHRAKAKATIQETDPGEPVEPASGELTEEELMKQTKGSLLELVETEGLKVDVNSTMSKQEIATAILAYVNKKKK